MNELPPKLRLELAMAMNQNWYEKVKFFNEKDKSFLVWITRLIKPLSCEENDYIYKEGEQILESKMC